MIGLEIQFADSHIWCLSGEDRKAGLSWDANACLSVSLLFHLRVSPFPHELTRSIARHLTWQLRLSQSTEVESCRP